ncbi:hypothetical protein V6N13_097644 [Hibiscus sabdariffa]|uniref:Expansin-like CBD domain-containing protein n=1 Tax=Hibiscus sabdariffa TaxID=183260 RepID=A0ABR2BUN8_9ROSI
MIAATTLITSHLFYGINKVTKISQLCSYVRYYALYKPHFLSQLTQNSVCKLLDRSHGAVWTTTSPPSGPLSLRMLLSGEDGDESWIVPVNIIPENWKGGETYDTGVQINV